MIGRRSRRRGGLPADFAGQLDADERVLAVATVRSGGHLVASTFGLWLPDGRRLGWHLISKASWTGQALSLIEAEVTGPAGGQASGAVLLADRPPIRIALSDPGKIPETVHARVTGSIRSRHHRELPGGGGAWFVQRKVAGQDGLVLQVRPDPGTDTDAVARLAAEVARRVRELYR